MNLVSLEPAVIFSRRHLLASLGLALPAVTVVSTAANATTAAHHRKHKGAKHGHSLLVSHKRRKPAAPPLSQS